MCLDTLLVKKLPEKKTFNLPAIVHRVLCNAHEVHARFSLEPVGHTQVNPRFLQISQIYRNFSSLICYEGMRLTFWASTASDLELPVLGESEASSSTSRAGDAILASSGSSLSDDGTDSARIKVFNDGGTCKSLKDAIQK